MTEQPKGKIWSAEEIRAYDPNKKRLSINVGVDDSVLNLARENAELKAKVNGHSEGNDAETQAAKELLQDMKEKASVELTALGIDTNPEDIRSKADLDRAIKTVQTLRKKEEVSKTVPSGIAPLSGQYEQPKNGYSSPDAMVTDLLMKEQYGNKSERLQAKQVLDQLTVKTLKGARDGNQKDFNFPKEESVIEKLNENFRAKKRQRSD